MTTLSGPMLPPLAGGDPRQLVVLLHGYGSDGEDLIALASHWRELLPDALFVSPNAPEVSAANPQGYQWFALDLERTQSRIEGAPLARPVVVAFLDALWKETGLTARDTILVGFSQGAMMAMHVGTSLPEPLKGVIAFSGAFIAPAGFDADAHAKPPICIVHGTADATVDPQLSIEAAQVLRAKGFEVSLHLSEGMGHGIDTDGLAFASGFISGLAAEL